MAADIFHGAKKLGFGLMRLPLTNPNDQSSIDLELVKKMVDSFLAQGFTYFDTAWMYHDGTSENAVKEVLVKRHPRDSYTLATKFHQGFVKDLDDRDRYFNEQLSKTGVSYFDYYLIHDINTESIVRYNELKAFEWIQSKKEQGNVRHIGFSYHDGPELLDEVLDKHPEIEFVQIQLNYLDYESPSVQSRACCEICEKHNKPVVIMEPVKGGTLVNLPESVLSDFKNYSAESSAASWAIRFAASQKPVRMVLSGMSNLQQVQDNTQFMSDFEPLNSDELHIIKSAVERIKSANSIACTGCSYCTAGCPKNIPIPRYFALYNSEMIENPDKSKSWTSQEGYYERLTLNFGKASECVQCCKCEHICPQHLPVCKLLKLVASRFEGEF